MEKLSIEIGRNQPYRKKLIRWNELKLLIPMSRSTLWRKIKDGTFPRSYRLSKRITAWKVSEINVWIEKTALHN